MFSFCCPNCPHNGFIQSETSSGLAIAIANHITDHETRAAIRAVDRARSECLNPECCIGMNRGWNHGSEKYEPKLTSFDRALLKSMKVSFAEPDTCKK